MIKSVQLLGDALHAVERLDAEVMLFSNPDAAPLHGLGPRHG